MLNSVKVIRWPKPLVDALSRRNAVAFLGAGASISAGLPTWRQFLEDLLAFAGANLPVGALATANHLFHQGDFLIAADLIQRTLDPSLFRDYLKRTFDKKTKPTAIHRAVARMPFGLFMTVNFDNLMEQALENDSVITWLNPDALYTHIKTLQDDVYSRLVVKMHGTIGIPDSLRLTRSHYSAMTHENQAFNECLKSLLLWKTFLFVGYSLRDSDLLHLIDDAKLRFGKDFGPHYAILPKDEADKSFVDYLRDQYSIHAIRYQTTGDRTDSVVRQLRELAGTVAHARAIHERLIDFNDPLFNKRSQCQVFLERAVEMAGVVRGDVCFVASQDKQKLQRFCTVPPEDPSRSLPDVKIESVMGTIFLKRDVEKDYILLDDTRGDAPAIALKAQGYPDTQYVECHTDVRSELACPIISDGRRVGVLNLESDVIGAFTVQHVAVARALADQLGWLYFECEQRSEPVHRLTGLLDSMNRFSDIIRRGAIVERVGLEIIMYLIDYDEGVLRSRSTLEPSPGPFDFKFQEKSAATRVLRERLELAVPDIREGIKQGVLNKEGVEHFRIDRGPLFSCPVNGGGHTASIMVGWPKRSKVADRAREYHLVSLAKDRVLRIANLLANDLPSRPKKESSAANFLDLLHNAIKSADALELGELKPSAKDLDSILLDAMQALLHECCGFRRVRVWHRASEAMKKEYRNSNVEFYCLDSLTVPESTARSKKQRGAYKNFVSLKTDIYCRYSLTRYRHDPYAKIQHPSMFGGSDQNCAVLDKDPNGGWIVAPIVYPKPQLRRTDPGAHTIAGNSFDLEILGFISVDNHTLEKGVPREQRPTSRAEESFQLHAANIAAEVLRFPLKYWIQNRSLSLRGPDGKTLKR